MPGRFSPPILKETSSMRSRYAPLHVRHTRAVMHVKIANLLCSRHSRRMCNPQFYVSGKMPMARTNTWLVALTDDYASTYFALNVYCPYTTFTAYICHFLLDLNSCRDLLLLPRCALGCDDIQIWRHADLKLVSIFITIYIIKDWVYSVRSHIALKPSNLDQIGTFCLLSSRNWAHGPENQYDTYYMPLNVLCMISIYLSHIILAIEWMTLKKKLLYIILDICERKMKLSSRDVMSPW